MSDPADGVYVAVGRRLAMERDALGMTQGEVAALAGIGRTSIVNIEAGRQRVPLHTLVAIAAALGVPLSALVPASVSDDTTRMHAEVKALRARLSRVRAALDEE